MNCELLCNVCYSPKSFENHSLFFTIRMTATGVSLIQDFPRMLENGVLAPVAYFMSNGLSVFYTFTFTFSFFSQTHQIIFNQTCFLSITGYRLYEYSGNESKNHLIKYEGFFLIKMCVLVFKIHFYMNRMIYTVDAYTYNSVYWIDILFDNYKEMQFKFICRRIDKYLFFLWGGGDSSSALGVFNHNSLQSSFVVLINNCFFVRRL